ncbi:MAG: beta strand repeat-containing protein, partial [Planctomycetota bacterium]
MKRFGTQQLKCASLLLLILAIVPRAQADPNVDASKDDALTNDVDGDTLADPGDTIKYTITITNTGNMDAEGMSFSDTIDGNTTLVVGSLKTTPIALDDSYNSIGNVGISVPAPGVLGNDSDPDGGSVTAVVNSGNSLNGGDFSLAADGSFTYSPPPGFNGNDTFNYTIQDTDTNTDTATVTIVVSGLIWFIDDDNTTCTPACDGRLGSPFDDLAVTADSFDVNAADSAGDNIFIYSGNYTSGLTLLNSQKLIGEGSSSDLATVTGLSLPTHSAALPTLGGTKPALSSSGDGVGVGQNNTIRGLDITAGTAGTAIRGTNVGTLTVTETNINGGGGMDINTGTLAVTLDSLSASSSTDEGILLSSVSGSFNVSGGTISTTSVPAVSISGNPTVGLGVTLESVSSSSGSAPGIKLDNTTGSFEVIGDGIDTSVGGNGSGGTISNKTGADNTNNGIGVLLNNATSVTLRRMQLNDFDNFAIRGTSVNGFELSFSTIDGSSGTSLGADEDCVHFDNLSGTALMDDNDISGGFEDNIRVINTTGTLNLSLTDSLIGTNGANGDDGVRIETQSSANATLTITNNDFTAAPGDLLNTNVLNSSVMDLLLQGNDFSNNHASITSGGGGVTIAGGGGGSSVTFTYVIDDNTFRDAKGIALNVFKGTGAGSFEGEITGNDIGVAGVSLSGSSQASGIRVRSNGTGTHTTLIDDNSVLQTNEAGIYLSANDGSSTLNATVTNNSIGEAGSFTFAGIFIDCGALNSDTNLICADVGGTGDENSFVGSGGQFGLDFVSATSTNATINMPGLAGGAGGVASYIQGRNTGTPTVDAFGNYTGSGTSCPTPPPLMAADGQAEHGVSIATLTADELAAAAAEAVLRWENVGLTRGQIVRLERVTFEIVDLPEGQLGSALLSKVAIDHDAAGHGWFIDASNASVASGRMDLLTAVMHELGHVLGKTHADAPDL